jgi:hypothetical protein
VVALAWSEVLRWGSAGEQVEQAWSDSGAGPSGRWEVRPDETLWICSLLPLRRRDTRTLVAGADLTAQGVFRGRFGAA